MAKRLPATENRDGVGEWQIGVVERRKQFSGNLVVILGADRFRHLRFDLFPALFWDCRLSVAQLDILRKTCTRLRQRPGLRSR